MQPRVRCSPQSLLSRVPIDFFLGLYPAALLLLYTAGAVLVPPTMFSDSAWGFLQAETVREGGQLWQISHPNEANIAEDIRSSLTVWAPGQYAVPMLFEALGLSLGAAMTTTVLVSHLLGLWGYYLLFRRLALSKRLTLCSIAVIASQEFVAMSYGIYDGGQVLELAASPWILLLVVQTTRLAPRRLVLLFLALLGGVFLKLSFLVTAMAASTFFVLVRWQLLAGASFTARLRGVLPTALRAALLFVLLYVFVQAVFLSRGWNATEIDADLPLTLGKVLFVLSAPLWSGFSVEAMLEPRLKLPTYYIELDFSALWWCSALGAVLTAWLVSAIVRRQFHPTYRALVVSTLGVYIVMFEYFAATAPAITLQERKFRVAGLLLVPAVLSLIAASPRRLVRCVLFALVLWSCLFGVSNYFQRISVLSTWKSVGRQGFTHAMIDRSGLRALHCLDARLPAGSLIYVSSPEIALELERTRALASMVHFQPAHELARRNYRSTVPELLVLLPKQMRDSAKEQAILASFKDYSLTSWQSQSVGSMVLYHQPTFDPSSCFF